MPKLVSAVSQNFPDVPNETVQRLVRDMGRDGFGVVTNYIQPRELLELRSFVASAVQRATDEYVAFTGRDAVSGTILDALYQSSTFFSLCKRVYEHGTRH